MDQWTLRFPLARFWVACLSLQAICHFAQGEPRDLLAGGAAGLLLEDATQEQGYYLQQLFRQYGENGTLSFEGLTRLLLSLGLGKVQVVEIEHEELGHGHVSHLDILEVQENKHLHFHSALDHISKSEHGAKTQVESVTPTRWVHSKDWKHPAGKNGCTGEGLSIHKTAFQVGMDSHKRSICHKVKRGGFPPPL